MHQGHSTPAIPRAAFYRHPNEARKPRAIEGSGREAFTSYSSFYFFLYFPIYEPAIQLRESRAAVPVPGSREDAPSGDESAALLGHAAIGRTTVCVLQVDRKDDRPQRGSPIEERDFRSRCRQPAPGAGRPTFQKKSTGGFDLGPKLVRITLVEPIIVVARRPGQAARRAVLNRPMASVELGEATPPLVVRGRAGFTGATITDWRRLFDNSVVCIRQPNTRRDKSRIVALITLEGSRRASGRSCYARSGWSLDHQAAGWLARTGTRFSWGRNGFRNVLLTAPARGGPAQDEMKVCHSPRRVSCDQYFFLNPCGEDRRSGGEPCLQGEASGNRLIFEGFDPGSE